MADKAGRTRPEKKTEEPTGKQDRPDKPRETSRPDHWRSQGLVVAAVLVLIVIAWIFQ